MAAEKRYAIEIPLTSEKQDDVTVGLNGNFIRIKRGEQVEIPEWAYEILMQSKEMQKEVIALKRKLGAM